MNEYRRMTGGKPWKMVLFPVLFIMFGVAMSFVVMLLWNAVIPGLTGWGVITFWKALGLLLLCRILFGGFRGGNKHGKFRPGMHYGFRNKWRNMSEEERAKFRENWRQRCDWNKGTSDKETVMP